MTKCIKILTATIGVTACLAIAACTPGTTQPPEPKRIVANTGAVSLDLGTDISHSTGDKALRQQYLAAGMQAAETVFQRGGHLAVSVFFSRGLHPVELLDAPVPGPGELGAVARAQKIEPIRQATKAALAEALGLADRRPELEAALAGVGGDGTDVAGSVAAGMTAVDDQANPVVIRLTDGLDATWSGSLAEVPAALAERIDGVLPQVGSDVAVALVGIGGGAQAKDTKTTQRLIEAWTTACERTGARCYVAPDLDLDPFIG
jgi:hypothetical protein